MPKSIHSTEETPPDQRKITKIQARRISELAGVKTTDLEHLSIAQAIDKFKWKIDPALFLFRRICGRVVKKDPVTGVEYPVPFATVHVEDTDCNLVSYFPKPWPWGWLFPFNCHREVIATTKTDRCGNFCVWVPRFDIDWILQWRRLRVCFPFIFKRPSILDLLPKLKPEVLVKWPPIPDPDPGPLRTLTTLPPSVIGSIAGAAAGRLAERVARLQAAQSFGSPSQLLEEVLNARAFERDLPPPLPEEFQQSLSGQGDMVAAKGASPVEGIRSAIAMKVGLDPAAKEFANFDPQRFIGPFYRCFDVFIPEWHLIHDVPDITFRVTQDTNGDGTQETIYSESYFDVRWDSGPIPDVTLVASSIARETHLCDAPVVPCGNVPVISFAGLMPLNNPAYFNATTGYALRPNRPSTASTNPPCPPVANPPRLESQAPFYATVNLFGCVDVQGAKHYRVKRSTDNGATFSVITGLEWNNYRQTGGVIRITADAQGWYAVNPLDALNNVVPRNQLEFPNLVLEWPTPALDKCVLYVEIGDGSKNVINTPPQKVAIQSDNTSPVAWPPSRLEWKFASDPDSTLQSLLGIPCPMIKRGATPKDIEIVFEVPVSAHHLRDACIYSSGCGGGSFIGVSDPQNRPSHWHKNVIDNGVVLYQRYVLKSSSLAGCYSFGCTARSRAINPDGQDGGNLLPTDWFEDVAPVYVSPSISVAVVNEN